MKKIIIILVLLISISKADDFMLGLNLDSMWPANPTGETVAEFVPSIDLSLKVYKSVYVSTSFAYYNQHFPDSSSQFHKELITGAGIRFVTHIGDEETQYLKIKKILIIGTGVEYVGLNYNEFSLEFNKLNDPGYYVEAAIYFYINKTYMGFRGKYSRTRVNNIEVSGSYLSFTVGLHI